MMLLYSESKTVPRGLIRIVLLVKSSLPNPETQALQWLHLTLVN